MSSKLEFSSQQKVPLIISAEKYLQCHIKDQSAEELIKQHHSDLNNHIEQMTLKKTTTHEIYSADDKVVKDCISIKTGRNNDTTDRMNLVGKMHDKLKVGFTLKDKDSQTCQQISLRGQEFSSLRYVTIKVSMQDGRCQLSLLPAHQILITQEASQCTQPRIPQISNHKIKFIDDNELVYGEVLSESQIDEQNEKPDEDQKDLGEKEEGQDDDQVQENVDLQKAANARIQKDIRYQQKYLKDQDDEK